MGLSHHSDEYHDMMFELRFRIANWINAEDSNSQDVTDKLDELSSVMNDYGAVDWT
jgi:hypothetical protein